MALDPGDRIEIKKRAARTLGQQEWRDIDLILSEFGLPTTDFWDGRDDDRPGYVLDMLKKAADDALCQLDDYLHPKAVEPAPPQPEEFDDPRDPWSGSGFKLFISHIHDAADRAGALRTELGRRSVDCFVAHDSIEPAEDWQDVIRYALASCDACLALLTPGFRESQWTDQEVGWCMGRGVLVVPVDNGLTPYGFLGRLQAYSVKKGQSPADIALGVFELLVRKDESRDAMARALVERWEMTGSFNQARENYGFLRTVPKEAWSRGLVNRVCKAREENGELRDASINWKESDAALADLFAELSYGCPEPPRPEPHHAMDDIPF